MNVDRTPPARTIPECTPEFLEEIHRKQEDVLRKLCSRYGIDADEFKYDDNTLSRLRRSVKDMKKMDKHGTTTLFDRITRSAQRSEIGLKPEQRRELIGICEEYGLACHRFFKIHNVARARAVAMAAAGEGGRIPASINNAGMIEDVYSNLLLQEALAKIKSFGFKDRDTVDIAGLIIAATARASKLPEAFILPVKPQEGALPQVLDEWYGDTMGGYAEKMKKRLNAENGNYPKR